MSADTGFRVSEVLEQTLRRIARKGCENYVKPWNCDGDKRRTEGNRYSAYRVCDPCQARRALAKAERIIARAVSCAPPVEEETG